MYVIQVTGGLESRVRTLVMRLLGDLVGECFIPRREVKRRVDGEWVSVTELLFPGYLFITTDDVLGVSDRLRAVPQFTRLLGKNDERITPLSPEEVSWLNALLEPVSKTVEMSVGVIEGDRVIVTDGPLVGHEGLISKINRYKRVVYLDMRMFGRTKTIKVGLEIVRKSD
ncbi:antiterminator LoaP [Olsenella profusa]|uniref:Antiterminator LoaP n=2 Tax=Olsenella profusa TaxID=138595 RepID=A0ABS2F304_9ACTN|nr:antiterminator LoaP [Olsenella profusa]